MTDSDEFHLLNIDPDDISDVLAKVEKSFGFMFARTELESIKTFGELCDMVISKNQDESMDDCTTQQAFYKIKNVMGRSLHIGKENITPQTGLIQIFGREKRLKRFII